MLLYKPGTNPSLVLYTWYLILFLLFCCCQSKTHLLFSRNVPSTRKHGNDLADHFGLDIPENTAQTITNCLRSWLTSLLVYGDKRCFRNIETFYINVCLVFRGKLTNMNNENILMSNSRQKFIWNSFPLIPPSFMSPTQTQQHPATGHIWIACQLQINKQTGEEKMKIQS